MNEREEQVYREMAEEAAHEHMTNTPAEIRTGISDRCAAALEAIHNLRREFDKVDYVDGDTGPVAWEIILDRLQEIIRSMR